MRRRSVRNDPISSSERDRGAVIVRFQVDLDKAVPVAVTPPNTTAEPRK